MSTYGYGLLAETPFLLASIIVLLTFGTLAFQGARLWLWTAAGTAVLWLLGTAAWTWCLFIPVAVVLNLRPLRRALITRHVMGLIKKHKLLPVISASERTAIEVGTAWIDKELFSGKPDFSRIRSETWPELTCEEQAFLDGPVEEVCRMTNDWQVSLNRDLPAEVWSFLKEKGFFGMIIPVEHGGLGFSALGHGAVIKKLASRSMPLAITVMVPNSLGPAELLLHYGTEAQRGYYLPRLAKGEEVPCFALTEPGAGSDAGSIKAKGEIFRGEDGKLYIRLNWEKRYITLAAVASVLGLAFHLHDPQNLLGQGESLGVTCALVPAGTEGVELGRRHDPMGIAFYNCPTSGHDVVVPIDAIIGGPDGAGRGWLMLMECLAAGRGVSLPSTSTGGAAFVARVAGAYATVRKQFGLSIGKFEGIEESLARIGGITYMLDAARLYTCGAIDSGNKPPVITAIAKLNSTELFRQIINDGMDILGGAALSRGPRNLLANPYMGAPISITVEGANILTRTMIIFGGAAIRCHPHAFDEIEAASKGQVEAFDRALFSHIGHIFRNASRAVLLSLSRGYLCLPPVSGPTARYYRKLAWASASFALMADVAMSALGGDLKRKEKLTGRFADILSWMYLGTAVLRRFEADGSREEHRPYMHWSMSYAFAKIHEAFQGLYQNMRVPGLGALLRGPVGAWSRLNPIGSMPSDQLGSKVAKALQMPGVARDSLTEGIHLPTEEGEQLALLEKALGLHHKADEVAKKIREAVRAGKLPKGKAVELVEQAVQDGVISQEEGQLMDEAEQVRAAAVAVDSFGLEEYLGAAPVSSEMSDAQY